MYSLVQTFFIIYILFIYLFMYLFIYLFILYGRQIKQTHAAVSGNFSKE